MEEKKGKGLAIAGMVLGIISIAFSCCGFFDIVFAILGLIFSIVSITKSKSKAFSIVGISTSGIAILVIIISSLLGFSLVGSEKDKEEETTELTTETTEDTEETTEATTEMSKDDFISQATEVSYDDIYRNPETYMDKIVKITVSVEKYDTQFLGLSEVYYCTMDGNDVFVTDYRSVKEPTIAKGDTVVIYGKGNGMATLTEEQLNEFGLATDSEKSLIPDIKMYYVELAN